SIAKLGQQNGLFCYSDPGFVRSRTNPKNPKTSTKELFSFVYSHYKTIRLFILLWCFMKFEGRLSLYAFIRAFFRTKYFKRNVDLYPTKVEHENVNREKSSIDVIIPSYGRKKSLLQVMEDLRNQSLLPKRVIIVEQNPDPNSLTDLPELQEEDWPFE